MATDAIVLAHEPTFRLGDGEARPATLELEGPAGIAHVEPRVMRVLVALHRAEGGVLSRDDLTADCWDGRIVGEDAINRVIGQLRRAFGSTGQTARIETIPRVGFRLRKPTAAGIGLSVPWAIDRRGVLAAGAAAAIAAGGAWAFLGNDELPPKAQDAMARGKAQLIESTAESVAAASAAYREAADIAPQAADPWAYLAITYAFRAGSSDPTRFADLRRKAIAASERALQLDPDSGTARTSRLMLLPASTPLIEVGRYIADAVRRDPRSPVLAKAQGFFYSCVGRANEALKSFERFERWSGPNPRTVPIRAGTLAVLGRDDEADQLFSEAIARWPRHYAVWFSRLKFLMFSGRGDRALAMLADVANRPLGISDHNFSICEAQARACADPTEENRRKGLAISLESATLGSGFAENAMLFASAAGYLDHAFVLANRLMLAPATLPRLRFDKAQAAYNNIQRAPTWELFEPPVRAMRRDPRMADIYQGTGLADYWRVTGIKPDLIG